MRQARQSPFHALRERTRRRNHDAAKGNAATTNKSRYKVNAVAVVVDDTADTCPRNGCDDGRRQSGMGFQADGLEVCLGSVSGIRTRRYHALLLTATTPPTGRRVFVNGPDAVDTGSGREALRMQHYAPDVFSPDGRIAHHHALHERTVADMGIAQCAAAASSIDLWERHTDVWYQLDDRRGARWPRESLRVHFPVATITPSKYRELTPGLNRRRRASASCSSSMTVCRRSSSRITGDLSASAVSHQNLCYRAESGTVSLELRRKIRVRQVSGPGDLNPGERAGSAVRVDDADRGARVT